MVRVAGRIQLASAEKASKQMVGSELDAVRRRVTADFELAWLRLRSESNGSGHGPVSHRDLDLDRNVTVTQLPSTRGDSASDPAASAAPRRLLQRLGFGCGGPGPRPWRLPWLRRPAHEKFAGSKKK